MYLSALDRMLLFCSAKLGIPLVNKRYDDDYELWKKAGLDADNDWNVM
jgi:hypothetical protein